MATEATDLIDHDTEINRMAGPKRTKCPECGGTGIVPLPTELTRGVWPPDEAPPPACPVCKGERFIEANGTPPATVR
jgi:hypothetical protein